MDIPYTAKSSQAVRRWRSACKELDLGVEAKTRILDYLDRSNKPIPPKRLVVESCVVMLMSMIECEKSS